MASIKMIGYSTEYGNKLAEKATPKQTADIFKQVLYVGAAVLADEVRRQIETIPEHGEDVHEFTPGKKLVGLTPTQKQGLRDGMGISPMKVQNGLWSIKVGFKWYNKRRRKTGRYKDGEPNQMIANAIEKGTTYRARFQFQNAAVHRAEAQAVETMRKMYESIVRSVMED